MNGILTAEYHGELHREQGWRRELLMQSVLRDFFVLVFEKNALRLIPPQHLNFATVLLFRTFAK